MNTFNVPFCLNCNEPRGNDAFCSFCGTALSEGENLYIHPKIGSCKQCGFNDMWPHENFCRQCGARQSIKAGNTQHTDDIPYGDGYGSGE